MLWEVRISDCRERLVDCLAMFGMWTCTSRRSTCPLSTTPVVHGKPQAPSGKE